MPYRDDDSDWEGCALMALGLLVAVVLIFAWFMSPSP